MGHGDSALGCSGTGHRRSARRWLHDLRLVFCHHSENYSHCKCACTLGVFCYSVRACTDLFSWMAGRGTGARPLPSDHHSQSTAANNDPVKVLRPSTHYRWRSSNARRVGLPHRYPEQLATPFLASENCTEIWVLVFDRSKTYFLYQTFQNQAAIRDHRKMEHLLFCPFWINFFCLLPFQVFFCPNKSHGIIFRGFP